MVDPAITLESTAKLARIALLAALVCILAGCGASAGPPDLKVSAAASLKMAFTRLGGEFHRARLRFSFAGSDQLAAQIERGARPDVFASANLKLPQALLAKGLVYRPRAFASNRLVLAVLAGSMKVRTIDGLTRPGVTVAIGSPSVPVGSYTRTVLARLGASRSAGILAHVRSEEPDVSAIVGKLTEGAVDAGIVYITDVRATQGRLRAIELPANTRPAVVYGIAIVKGSAHLAQDRAFVGAILKGAGQQDLRDAGFGAADGL